MTATTDGSEGTSFYELFYRFTSKKYMSAQELAELLRHFECSIETKFSMAIMERIKNEINIKE